MIACIASRIVSMNKALVEELQNRYLLPACGFATQNSHTCKNNSASYARYLDGKILYNKYFTY